MCVILVLLLNTAIHLFFCMAEEKQDSQKTLVAFVVGLLIGGMIVWAFSGPAATAPVETTTDNEMTTDEGNTTTANESDDETSGDSDSNTNTETSSETMAEAPAAELVVGEGSVVVTDQPAGTSVTLESATYPVSEGWIGVREYNNEQLGYILGVVRFSEAQGLVPAEIVLQRATTPGNEYAVVIFTEDGDYDFNLGTDVQIDTVYDTFSAE